MNTRFALRAFSSAATSRTLSPEADHVVYDDHIFAFHAASQEIHAQRSDYDRLRSVV